MNKVAHYLQQHLVGEVLVSPDVLKHFSTDDSILQIQPMMVAHPRNENDLRKVARFTWQLAERGRIIPITIRGKGTDQTGASVGPGIVLSTPAHMNKIIELDPKSGVVTVQAGILAASLQQTLYTHGRFLPSLSSSHDYTTIGGAVANNEAGPDSYRYGPIRERVSGLRVVLANGELIKTNRLSKREFNKKLGLASFEGHLYRELDKLIEENAAVIESLSKIVERSNAGYAIADVKSRDGSFDLTPVIIGSQGTLGLISEVTFDSEAHNPDIGMIVASIPDRTAAFSVVQSINAMKTSPLSLDFLDKSALEYVTAHNPNLLKKSLSNATASCTLFIAIEGSNSHKGKKLSKKIVKLLEGVGADVLEAKQDEVVSWQVTKESVSLFLSDSKQSLTPLPIISDASVPPEKCAEFLDQAEELLRRTERPYIVWGQAGSGIIHASVMFDITQIGDKQKMFKLMDEYYSLVLTMGGALAGECAEGRLHGALSAKMFNTEQLDVMQKIKSIFDPYATLNPGVKVQSDLESVKQSLRSSYVITHQHGHLKRG